jgi:DnaD/phage-associated family protein
MGGGFAGLEQGLAACARTGVLLVLRLEGPAGDELVYFVNNPPSRNAVMRARAGELTLRPLHVAIAPPPEVRPGIFRIYEEHVGTITPFVGERLLLAAELYSIDWIERAFREAAELNVRNWRYVERTLERWSEEGRPGESTRRTPGETHALFAPGRPPSR